MKALGRHLLLEFYGCDPKIISELDVVEKIMVRAAKATRAIIVDVVFHTFTPPAGGGKTAGVSGVVVIQESHLAVHTWPEHGCASIDIYTCGGSIDPWKAYTVLKKGFKARRMTAMEMKRGILNS